MPYKNEEDRKACCRRYYLEHKEKCNAATRRSYQKYKVERRKHDNKKRLETRIEVLTHYGNGSCTCIHCGFSDVRALTLDHINGGGKKDERNRRGTNLAPWLKFRGYPEGIQTLCMNCQFIKKIENKEQTKGKLCT